MRDASSPFGTRRFFKVRSTRRVGFFFFWKVLLAEFCPALPRKKLIWNSIKFFFFFFRLHGRHRFFDSIEFFFFAFHRKQKKNNRPPPFMVRKVSVLKKKKVCIRFSFFLLAHPQVLSFLSYFFFGGGRGIRRKPFLSCGCVGRT